MIQDIYIRFYNLIKIKWLALILAYLFNVLYRAKFLIKKALRHKEIATMSYEKAVNMVDEVYPKKDRGIEFVNPQISTDLDLSVIVTVYNYESKLEKNIKSCINQITKYNYEVIFVNDGSTDSSLEIINKYADNPRVKVIDKKNGGAASARNAALNIATGKYVMFVDCDDLLHEDIVEKLLNCGIKNDNDIVMCAHNLVKTQGGKIISTIPYVYPAKNLLSYKNGGVIMNYPGFPWGKIYKRELFNNVRFPEGCWYEDTITLFLLFTQSKSFKYIEEPLYDYYIHESNITNIVSNTKNIKVIDRYRILPEILDMYLKYGNSVDGKFYELLLKHTSLFYYNNIKNLDSEVVEALFVLAKNLVLSNKPKEKIKLSYMLRQVEKAFINNDMALWRLVSVCQ